LAAAIAVCVASIAPSNAADIKLAWVLGETEVVLEGPIVSGDYDKLQSFVETNEVKRVYLASPGGSVTEAIKIGRLVRELKLKTLLPVQGSGDFRKQVAEDHKLTNAKDNYLCASACFFIFVAGIERQAELGDPILGIHRPYLTDGDLRSLSGGQAMSSASQLRVVVENYLKEMGVPSKYADLMFSVPKDEVRWIGRTEFRADLEGIVPELKDWVDARCDKRTDVEKAAWAALKNSSAQMTEAERLISGMLGKKMSEMVVCSSNAISGLSHKAHLKMFWEPRKAALCAEYRSDGRLEEGRLEARLAAAVPNEASAAALLDDVKNAGLCGHLTTATGERFIRALAERGDARAQRGLGVRYFYRGNRLWEDSSGTQHISNDSTPQDRSEGVKWFLRAANQGDADAQGQLSAIYGSGDGGLPQSYVEALKWLTIQASQSTDNSDFREVYISKMTPQQIAEAERLASQWRPTPEGGERNQSSGLPTKNEPPWWQFWK
jgi:TPR repeat protein